MRHTLKQRLLASLLAGALLASCCPLAAFAADSSAAARASGETVAGEPETVKVSADAPAGRETNFNDGWKFYLGTSSTAMDRNFNDSSWANVTLPHDFSISQSFTTTGEAESGFLPGGTGWYRKTFTLPASSAGKTLVLNFDGAYADAYVYVNGTLLGENHYGYTSFAFDITDYVTCDDVTENVVAVKVVNNIPSSRWYSGSGIYRDVTLITTDPVHVAYNGISITTPDIENGIGTVSVTAELDNNSGSSVEATLRITAYDASGAAASTSGETTVTVAANNSASVSAQTVVGSPALWDTETPNLYTLRTEVLVDNTVVDSCETEFGFRYYRFDDDTGFYLNGKALKLNGVCLHHDQGALGSAAYYDAMYRQLSKMKDMGVNAVRTSHNPADQDFIRICNELGLLVIEEAFDGWSISKNSNSYDFGQYFSAYLSSSNGILGGDSSMTWAEFSIKSMVRRDRNNPCVILWSLGNEIQEGASADSSFPTIAQNLINWIKEEDTTRPATIGSNQRTTSGTLGSVHSVVDNNGGIVGFNYASSSELASMHSAYGAIIASETSSAVNSRGIYSSQANAANADGKYHLTSYDTSKVSWGKTACDSMWDTLTLDYVAGEFVWTGWDYIGEPTPWNGTGAGSVSGSGAVPNSSYFGIVDTAGFEKDTYYLYRSQWNQKDTTLHLVTAWDSDNMMTTSGKTPVVVYSNAPKVELYRNGTLVGTATRTANTTSAGHTYYTYTTTSNNSSVCTAVTGSGSSSLYATFNVTYASGTLSAKAYDASGNEITATSGTKSVTTPGAVSQLSVTQDKTSIAADGSSLAYIAVEVQDANGVLDTTASNTITFTLTGDGEILGVDNGDQATTDKYQQSTVLTSSTSAQIAAYAGKALVIVRSTKDAGSFTVTASASGLTGGSATVTTTAVEDGSASDGLVSYTLVRDYTVMAGTAPQLQTSATGAMADGSTVAGQISWDAVPGEVYSCAGDYTISGVLTFEGQDDLTVTARLHVIDNVIAMRNISAVTKAGEAPTLPSTVRGVLEDGTLSGEFSVAWETVDADQFSTVGSTVMVTGSATVMGSYTLPVTASVRVAEAINTDSTNVAPSASSLTQDIAENKQSDNLSSLNNGVLKPGDNTDERWSNWNNRTTSATAALTFQWATAQLLSSVNLYYYFDSCSALPESVAFEYSLNGVDFTSVPATAQQVETYSLGAEYSYTFDSPINPVALRITLTQQSGTSGSNCVALTEVEIMTYAGSLEVNSSAALSELSVDGVPVSGFDADTLEYTAAGEAVTAASQDNAGITVLPALDNVVRVLTVSEDGSDARVYSVTLDGTPACPHANTELRNAAEAACETDGYTGDTYCLDCGALVSQGEVISALGHQTQLQNVKAPTCTEEGYSGDQVCTVCGDTVEAGRVTAAAGHSYDSGVVIKPATETEEGEKTYTCTVCGDTRTEVIPKLEVSVEKTAPQVSVSAAQTDSGVKITLTGTFLDYENQDQYYDVTAHGLIYYSAAKLGTRTLTVNTPGRTRINFSKYAQDGSFTYTMTPAYANTRYVVRAFLAYTADTGRTVYVYSKPITVSYNDLAG